MRRVSSSYLASLGNLESNRAELLAGAVAKYPGVSYDVDLYYRLLRFDFSDELKAALAFYFDQAYSLGLLDKVDSINYWTDQEI